VDQAIFGPAGERSDFRAGQSLHQPGREGAAQVRAVHGDPDYALPFQVARQTAHGGFDFGKFWHNLLLSAFAQGRNSPKAQAMNETVSFGYEEVAPEEKAARVGAVFSSVAKKYDLMNDAMSGGMHRLWKDRFVRRVKPQPGEAILDMAGGTGDIAFRLAAAGADVTVSDINQDMLDVGIERAMERGLDSLVWSRQNAEELTFPDRFFDAYTIAFGIRNVTRIDAALAEAHRVLRYGGRFFCLEFSTTEWPGFKQAYDLYSHKLVPQLGKAIAGDAESYRYLIESIRRFPPMREFEGMIRKAGFVQTRVEPLLGGLVAIHSGWKV
jgi:demethylmenaquinone methyltransferase / 2-methoxy-6-polyprenyl-1,4-benzoquinol methylase